MITKDDLKEELLNSCRQHNLIQWSTGTGKSAAAIALCEKMGVQKVLIVIPVLVLENNWKEQFNIWNTTGIKLDFITYRSFYEKLTPEIFASYDCVICDECHHLTDKCKAHLLNNRRNIKHFIGLSATIPTKLKYYLRAVFPSIYITEYKLRQAIDNETLPDPELYLIQMRLDNEHATEKLYVSGRKANKFLPDKTVSYSMKDKVKWYSDANYYALCTPAQVSYYYDSKIDEFNNADKVMLMKQYGSKRLAFLSSQKTDIVKKILRVLKDRRVITFCNNTTQCKEVGGYQIHSKDSKSDENLIKFNEKKIKHITCCKSLDEGQNLADCEFSVYANLNSSDRIVAQRLGRALRHQSPKVIIPYFLDTRDEQLIRKMLDNYNRDLIHYVKDINDLNL